MKSVTNRYKPAVVRNRIEDMNRMKGRFLAIKSKSRAKGKSLPPQSKIP